MNKVKITVYKLSDVNDEFYSEVSLEVEFDLDTDGSYLITSYNLDSKTVDHNDFKDENPSLDKRIEREIEHYIVNHEPDYMDCE